MSDESLRATFDRHRVDSRTEPCPPWTARAERLRRLRRLLLDRRSAFCAAISADFGHRPAAETELLELVPGISSIDHALRHGQRWMRPRRRFADTLFLPARTELRPQPRGVVGIIVPWNYPLYLAVGPLVDALAAGNRVLVKMSEYTPCFAAEFAASINAGLGDAVAVVTGDADVARAFSALPFDHLLFTGSTAVGRSVMRSAADNLTPVTLELGGKSPAIIGPDARFAHAVERILAGKLVNAGQTCIAPDYVLLPQARIGEFIDTAARVVAARYPAFATNRDYASIISDGHFRRLAALREDAVRGGATAHPLAPVPDDASTRRLVPTLLVGVVESMRVMQEEIFGPLLPLVGYASFEEALAFVRERADPLSMYVFDDDPRRVEHAVATLRAGGVTVNDTLFHIAQHDLPFGGVGGSGIGAYHGEAGFRTFSRMTPVFRQSRANLAAIMAPPYGRGFHAMLRVLLGRRRR